jgi:predicted RNA-binding protein with PUA-like domain
MRDRMQAGDMVLFYHSGKRPSVVGTATVIREAYPDDTAWDPESRHFDPKSTPEKPLWYKVDVRLDRIFETPIYLDELKAIPELSGMMLLRKGNRLSVQPVSPREFQVILSRAAQSNPTTRSKRRSS